MPPQPIPASLRPARTRAVLKTAPRPVVTPQPISATRSSGTSGGIRTSAGSPSCASRAALVRAAHGRLALAEVRAPGDAVLARAAERRETADHVVPGRHVTHLAAHALDDARRLVPEDGRQRLR